MGLLTIIAINALYVWAVVFVLNRNGGQFS